MKQYVVLFVAFIMMVKPLWPVAEYIANYDYIKNVLCENRDKPMLHCDGKCYLAKQLAKESEENSKNPFGEKQAKVEIQPVVFFQSLLQIEFGLDTDIPSIKNYKIDSNLISLLLTSDLSEPPECA
ncbi:hypothetical protein SAMN05421766_10368 [Zobellia uliginosa]|uniref:Uncharacterized protein n=1 Tax=Zobellia uliginosa TaxID=143224 RepID=A0ABY1KQ29_9FLAO|nr:hypothetical protein [Zobellia uliginosa]SIS63872.1 hypothetical protein SAMN05421766_10368 [Zobellia uliginosa]